MKPIRYVFSGLCSLALVSGPMLDALAAGMPDESWQTVPDETLRDLRGGLDLGPLIGNFAIQRVVEVDGQVVARMQIVIANLNRLGQGGMPTVTISGPLAELVQVFSPSAASMFVAPATPAAASAQTPSPPSTVATNNGPHIGSTSGNSGTVSATGTKTGSLAQFGAGLSQAVAAANGALGGNAPAPANSSAAPATASSTSAAPLAPSTASTAALASATNPAGNSTRTIPVGNTGQVILVSNIPNATAITSEVQNSVQATRVQTMTTITATLNSLQLLSAAAIANAVRQQIAVGH
jgi:hypothetical protein